MMCWKNKPKLNILTVNSGNHLIDHYVPALLWNSSNGSQSGPLDLLSNRYSCLISQEWNATLSFIILAHTEANSSYSLPVKRTRWKWWKFCRHGTKRSSVVSLSNSANGVLETLIDFLQWFFVHQSIRIDRWTTWDNYGLWDPGHSNLILEKQPISESSGEIYHGSTVIWGYCIKKKKTDVFHHLQIISELYETKSDHQTAFLPDWNPRAREAWLWSDDRLQKASGKKDAMGRPKKSLVFGTHDTLEDMKGSRVSE